ncbi:MAG: glycoside hydrolase family 9 protein [Spirochaetota bacterium]
MSTHELLTLNEHDYLEKRGLNVMLAHDYYPDGHQAGVSIIQNGRRVATNGDVRLDRSPGQWSPVPAAGERRVDRDRDEISVRLSYPDPAKNRTGFNPIDYPDLELAYTIRVRPEGEGFVIVLDLEQPLPSDWVGRAAFMLELFPGFLFGKSFTMDDVSGPFPRQPNSPGRADSDGSYRIDALATGTTLTVAPESDEQRMRIESRTGTLELLDGRGVHNNGWFVVRGLIPGEKTSGALEWFVAPHAIPGWTAEPVVQVSQVGYHPDQPKFAVVELDSNDDTRHPIVISRVNADGSRDPVVSQTPPDWGRFLRFTYLRLDFSSVTEPGLYVASYGDRSSNPFRIARDVYSRHVWRPTLDYFLPVQMCHMRVNDRSRVWHGACHLDDARMAPTSHIHFDGYSQGPSTLSDFEPGDHVPGLGVGGWHDAGDHDLRVESQAVTVFGLALAHEAFDVRHDNTTIDQARKLVEIHRPDGTPDILQQIEHGCLSIVAGYRALGRLYRGIICPELRQYTLLGDPVNQTDGVAGTDDDRWVFTEDNPRRELLTAACLAAASRPLRDLNAELADECLTIAAELRATTGAPDPAARAFPGGPVLPAGIETVAADVELLLSTGERRYADAIVEKEEAIVSAFEHVGWLVGRALPSIASDEFAERMHSAARSYRDRVDELEKKTPYGVPYEPNIWGAGWAIQRFGMQQYFLHSAFPEVFPKHLMLNALNFVLGCHPGSNTSSFVSGVGARSLTVAYGLNRDDWSYIPGGSASGTALIRPDYPELLEWPHLWQQTEYVLGGGTTDYLILALAADHVLNEP